MNKIIWFIKTLKLTVKLTGILKFTVNLNYLALKSMKFTVKLSSSSEH